jgi:hypothetical protein
VIVATTHTEYYTKQPTELMSKNYTTEHNRVSKGAEGSSSGRVDNDNNSLYGKIDDLEPIPLTNNGAGEMDLSSLFEEETGYEVFFDAKSLDLENDSTFTDDEENMLDRSESCPSATYDSSNNTEDDAMKIRNDRAFSDSPFIIEEDAREIRELFSISDSPNNDGDYAGGLSVQSAPVLGASNHAAARATHSASLNNSSLNSFAHIETSNTRRTPVSSARVVAHFELRDADVLCQRGGEANRHPGNQMYLFKRDELQPVYKATTCDRIKRQISETLINYVHSNGGRFIKRDGDHWVEISDSKAREKASQALRDINTKEARKDKRQRYPKKKQRRSI